VEQILSPTNCRLPLPALHNKKHNSGKTIVRLDLTRFEDPFGDPFEAMAQQQEEDVQPSKQALSDIDKQIRENVFVRMVTNKNAVYEGEPINATLKLYYRLNFGNVQMSKAPKFDGFWSQEGEQNPNQKPTVETINGQQFYVLELQKYTLFPQRSGALQISPTEIKYDCSGAGAKQTQKCVGYFWRGTIAKCSIQTGKQRGYH
jgi:hypothetical protein